MRAFHIIMISVKKSQCGKTPGMATDYIRPSTNKYVSSRDCRGVLKNAWNFLASMQYTNNGTITAEGSPSRS